MLHASQPSLDPVTAQVMREFHGVYTRLQKAMEGRVDPSALLSASAVYREILTRAAQEVDSELDSCVFRRCSLIPCLVPDVNCHVICDWPARVHRLEAQGTQNEAQVLALSQQTEQFKITAVLWHLLEALYLSKARSLVEPVKAWLSAHFYEPVEAQDWFGVVSLILQGQVGTAQRASAYLHAFSGVSSRFV